MNISCIIVDDEPLALDLLANYVSKTPFLILKHRCDNAIQALKILEQESIDLIFLDIQMPELSGIELSRVINREPKVIFTTAFDHYALEGFKVNAIDYLLKPFNYEEFLKASLKAKEWIDLSLQQNQSNPEKGQYIFVKSEYKQIKIALDDIQYIEGLKDYVKIWIKDNPKPIMTLLSLKSLESELPSTRFMRIHRSFIVALDKIQSIERNQVIINALRITVADQYKSDFQNFISSRSIR